MMFWSTLAMSLREITRNKMRSTLTALGIVIGVAAVIAMVHLGDAATRNVTQQIASMGQNLLIVSPGTRGRGPGGTRADAKPFDERQIRALVDEVPGILVAPSATTRTVVVAGNVNWPTTVLGTTETFFEVRDWPVASGRAFEPNELRSAMPVCILGATVARELFGQSTGAEGAGGVIDQQVRVGKLSCRVVGVLSSKQSMMGSDQDDIVLLPLRTFQRRVAGNWDVGTVYVSALEDGSTPLVKEQLETILREQRRIAAGGADDFNVRDMAEVAETVQGTTQVLTILLGAIAGVSLLVGGIGIMNIMLVSVTERTREIGIRLAIGARGGEVLWQFLIEAAVLSILGGLVGIALGVGGSYLACAELGLPFAPVPGIIGVAFVFSAFVGIAFGWWPARKAAALDPIEALRHE